MGSAIILRVMNTRRRQITLQDISGWCDLDRIVRTLAQRGLKEADDTDLSDYLTLDDVNAISVIDSRLLQLPLHQTYRRTFIPESKSTIVHRAIPTTPPNARRARNPAGIQTSLPMLVKTG